MRWLVFKNRVACSRPGLAYAILRGWTVAYKVNVNHVGVGIGSQTKRGCFVKCSVRDPFLHKDV